MRLSALLLLLAAAPLAAQSAPGGPGGADDLVDALAPALPRPAGGLVATGRWGSGPAYALARGTDGTAFIAQGGTVRAVDPVTGVVLGETVLPGVVYDLALDGTRLYAGTRANRPADAGLYVLDASDPVQLSVSGAVLGQNVYGIEVRGTRAYLSANANGPFVAVADVADAAAPAVLGSLALSGFSYGLEVVGTTAYVATGTTGLAVVDVSDASAPALASTLPLPRYTRRVEALPREGGGDPSMLAVAAGSYADNQGAAYLLTLDGATGAPALAGTVSVSSVAEDVAWDLPNALYIAASQSGLGVLYVPTIDGPSFPGSPFYLSMETSNLVSGANRVEASTGGLSGVLAADYHTGLHRDLGTGTPPVEGGSFAKGAAADATDPGVLWVAAGSYGLVRLGTAAPDGPRETRRTRSPAWNYSYDVAQTEAFVYVADGYSGVFAVRKSTGEVTAQLTDLPYADRVEVVGGQTLVAAGQGQMATYALASPGAPLLASGPGFYDAYTLASRAGALYVGQETGTQVDVFGLSAAGVPSYRTSLASEGTLVGVAAAGTRLYAYGGVDRVSVFDASVADAPVAVGVVDVTPSFATAADGLAYYTASAAGGLAAYDVSDLAAVVIAATAPVEAGAPYDISAVAGRVHVMSGNAGVYAFTDATVAGEAAPSRTALTVAAGPNPSRGWVAVEVQLSTASPLRVDVLDALGRRVATLAGGMHAAGAVALSWDARGLPAGVYTVRAAAGAESATARVTHLR